jgi:hypothetical protein
VFTDDSSSHRGLADSSATRQCSRVEINVSREIPRAIDSEVHVKRRSAVESQKKMLPNGVGIGDEVTVEQNAITESTLRARDDCSVPDEMLTELCRDAVNGMTLWHA